MDVDTPDEVSMDDGQVQGQQASANVVYPENEVLSSQGIQRSTVWLIKIPDFVQEQWAQADPGAKLGTFRLYNNGNMELLIPIPAPSTEQPQAGPSNYNPSRPASPAIPPPSSTTTTAVDKGKAKEEPGQAQPPAPERILTLDMKNVNEGRDMRKGPFKWLFKEKDRTYDFNGKSRVKAEPKVYAPIQMEVNLTPRDNDEDKELYKAMVKSRYDGPEFARPRMKRLQDEVKDPIKYKKLMSGQKLAASNVVRGHRDQPLKNSVLGKHKPAWSKPDPKDLRVRMEKGQLIDILLGQVFTKWQYWNFKGLCERTQQPEAWMREVLAEIAVHERGGQYAGLWRVQDRFKQSINEENLNKNAIPEDYKPTTAELAEIERLNKSTNGGAMQQDIKPAVPKAEEEEEDDDDDEDDSDEDQDMEEI